LVHRLGGSTAPQMRAWFVLAMCVSKRAVQSVADALHHCGDVLNLEVVIGRRRSHVVAGLGAYRACRRWQFDSVQTDVATWRGRAPRATSTSSTVTDLPSK